MATKSHMVSERESRKGRREGEREREKWMDGWVHMEGEKGGREEDTVLQLPGCPWSRIG